MKSLDKTESIDWQRFGSIDLNRLNEEIGRNDGLVRELGAYIGFCDVNQHFDLQQLDQNFVKLFKCSQILIKYLLNEFNRSNNSDIETKSNNNLFRENKKLRKLLEIHQKAMTYSRTLNGDYVQCPHCPKVFFDTSFLHIHVSRRHPNESLDSKGMLSLTNKIDDYQKVILGDNKNLDQFKNEIQILTEKLTKTEMNLMKERDERIKLEERMEYIIKVRDKEIQQMMREEMEELKFVQKERDFDKEFQVKQQKSAKNSIENISQNEEQYPKSGEVNKIEEMIAMQAKEMIKLGNNVQKLVSHLTDKLPDNSEDNLKLKPFVSELKEFRIKQKDFEIIKEKESKDKIKSNEMKNTIKKTDIIDRNVRRNSSDSDGNEDKESISKKSISIDTKQVSNEVESSLNQYLNSCGIDLNSKYISEDEYSNAMIKVNEKRKHIIHENRFDFNYESIEQQIRDFVDKKANERSGDKLSTTRSLKNNITNPKVRDRKLSIELEPKKGVEKHSIEAIVHKNPVNESNTMSSDQSSDEEMVSKEPKSKSNESLTEVLPIEQKSPKSSLKPIISERKTYGKNEVKANQKRISFSEHRIEHQISPEESSEESSEEYVAIGSSNTSYVSLEPNQQTSAPIPAQRTQRSALTLNLNTEPKRQTEEDMTEDTNYEIDDQMMNEILQTNSYTKSNTRSGDQSVKNTSKVHELTEMIEQQLNRRSAAHKRPPVGAVNVISGEKQNLQKFSNNEFDSDSDESETHHPIK